MNIFLQGFTLPPIPKYVYDNGLIYTKDTTCSLEDEIEKRREERRKEIY